MDQWEVQLTASGATLPPQSLVEAGSALADFSLDPMHGLFAERASDAARSSLTMMV